MEVQPEEKKPSLINQIFTKDQLKMMYVHACRIDIDDNNDKAYMLQEMLGDEFHEIGTGTNRMTFHYNPGRNREFRGGAGLIFEFALDRRGFIDSWTEFKRSIEVPEYIVKVYETNVLMNIEEYINLMDINEFRMNENQIKTILKDLSKGYIFEDIGFDTKNYENYGYRDNGEIVILDAGYIYPLKGNEHAMSCPRCHAHIRYNANYTGFICENPSCRTKYDFLDIYRRMDHSLQNTEDQILFNIMNCDIPDFDRLNV